ncbi:succinate dehydrogenase and fumarate reductase iron-sulfur protein [Synechococcus sp. PCC 7502]|uniref:succinate dehydrogenase/fumarate reductase iron-sulfur subunit n=1 Tax=Synechococcus sp. PCC 7502 TaxID=1173263 RepID=UPI00029FA65E|nr:succinate dehydrogenase/fumarate reductase iron-sulfur subunit [Synechococcus sp. PCC 7502]AFY74875.1 succinate dehydrogenase and fumarate reductase iron-sulfur protein [Synechococcus sp. PCC 7502]
MEISVKVRRQASRGSSPNYHTYKVAINPDTSTVLDVLQKIQWEQDGSLVFRRNCRNVICGSCGMRINGKAGLACQKLLSEVLDLVSDAKAELTIEPMGNLPVIKDLVVDMTKFWQNLAKVDPYVFTASRQISKSEEFLQTPAQRHKLQAAANCILCGSCYSECNAATVNENFVGPHALAKAYRVLADNRDDRTDDRINKYNDTDFVWGCTRCYNCNEVCPVEVEPLDRISQIKHEILEDSNLPESTAQRHRHVMVELVKADGWIDESKFGVKVVGNNFKDIKGLLSIVPLGLRMIASGKMPYPWFFQASEGIKEITALITALQNRDKDQDQTEVIEETISRGG